MIFNNISKFSSYLVSNLVLKIAMVLLSLDWFKSQLSDSGVCHNREQSL